MRTLIHWLLIVSGCFAVSASEQAGRTVVITARPRFEQQSQFVDLLLNDTNRSYRINWGMPPDVQFVPVTLDTNRVYTFTVAAIQSRSDTIPELRRIQLDGKTIYDVEVCEVHQRKMGRPAVKIVYGLIARGPDEPSNDTERRLFPHHREYSLGGCVVSAGSPKTEKIYVCAECRKAYWKWKTDKKKTP